MIFNTRLKYHLLSLFSLSFFLSLVLHAQEIPLQMTPQLEHQLDQHFSQWENQSQPGVAAGAIKDGKVIYLKGFGVADLEQQRPISPETKFNIGALSGHFTAFAILLLEEQGELSLSDDIRKYLPEIPDFEHKITIKHLLSQSHGLHEFWAPLDIIGWGGDDVLSSDHVMALVKQQKQLDYKPGTQFSRSKTGLVLLPKIVENVTGVSFANFMQEHIFTPLGMNNTLVCDDHEQAIPGAAISYQETEGGYKRNVINHALTGSTNIYTSVTDLCKWFLNFENPKLGSPALMKKMESPVTLDNGKNYNSTAGVLMYGQLFEHLERGVPKLWNYGMTGAYASNLFRFHKEGVTTFVMGNNSQYNGAPTMEMAFDLLGDIFPEPRTIDFTKVKTVPLHLPAAERLSGYYWNEAGAYATKVYLKNDTLRYQRMSSGVESVLLPIGEKRFQMLINGDDKIIVHFAESRGVKQLLVSIGGSDDLVSKEYIPVTYAKEELNQFAGTYYCDALNTGYTFSIEEGQLTARHLRKPPISFTPIKEDLFKGSEWCFSSVEFQRNAQKEIIGFIISFDGFGNLEFRRLQDQ